MSSIGGRCIQSECIKPGTVNCDRCDSFVCDKHKVVNHDGVWCRKCWKIQTGEDLDKSWIADLVENFFSWIPRI